MKMSLMPSLTKYFATLGSLLTLGLIGLSAVMQPGGPGPQIIREAPKAVIVKHDPNASLVERMRDDEAARKAPPKAETPAAIQPATQPQPIASVAATVVPASAAEPALQDSAPAALAGTQPQEDAAAVERLAKEKLAAEKAHKKRLARARAKAKIQQEAALSRMQDQTYYSYAQRPAFGPFGQGGGGWTRW
jgi:hypothetical protein